MRDEDVEQQRIADAGVRAAMRAAGIEGAPLRQRIRRRFAARPPHQRRILLTAASLVIALLAAGIISQIAPQVPRLYWEAAAEHDREVVDGRGTLPLDEAPIASLAKGQGVAASVLQALGRGGYRPKKGAVCRLDGRLFLHLLYSDGTRAFSAYLRRRDSALAGAPAEIHLGAAHLVFLRGEHLTLLLVAGSAEEAAARAHFAAALL